MAPRIRFVLAALIVSLVAGCTSSTHPSDTQTVTLDGRFGFVWNGGIYLSKNNVGGSSTDVELSQNFGMGVDTNTKLLWISLYYSFLEPDGSLGQIDAE